MIYILRREVFSFRTNAISLENFKFKASILVGNSVTTQHLDRKGFLRSNIVLHNLHTCIWLSFSLFLIQAFPWPCGSINRGKRVAFVTIMPFWTDSSSFGKPWRFHSPTWNHKIGSFKEGIPKRAISVTISKQFPALKFQRVVVTTLY